MTGMKTFYRVEEWDGADGRTNKVLFYTPHESTAKLWVKRSPYDSYFKHEIMIIETLEEYDHIAKARNRKSALAKLTEAEKISLGITE